MHHTHTTYIHKIGNTYLPITSIISCIELHKLQLRNIRLAAAAAAAAPSYTETAPALTEDTVQTHICQDFYSSYPT